VELNLAARLHPDFADVVNIIRFNKFDESFGQQPKRSVRQDYIEYLAQKRRED
jgi:hypothetical protein